MAPPINVDNVLFSRAKWRLRFLIPCWAVQMVVLLCLMGIFAYRVAETMEHYGDEKQNGQIPTVEIVWESTNVGFSTFALICTIIEIAKMATEALTPFAMLCSHILKLTLAFAMLALDITVYVQNTDRQYSIVGLSLDCGFLAVTIATFIYSLTVFLRLLKYEAYHETEGAKGPFPGGIGHQAGDDVEMMGNSVSITARHGAYRDDDEGDARGITLKAEVDRCIGAEFGWAPAPGVDRSSSIVGRGVVSSRKASPTEIDVGRSRSYVTERGLVSDGDDAESEDEGARRMRVSDEVVSSRGLDEGIPVVVARAHDDGVEEDRRALLGGQ